jgi:lipopolysaccharide export system protein LptA
MRWQKVARFAIAVFVVIFAGFVFLAMRKRASAPATPEEVRRADPKAIVESEGGEWTRTKNDRVAISIKYAGQLMYADGTSKLKGVVLTLPDRDGKTYTVTSDFADVSTPPDKSKDITLGKLYGHVTLKTNSGLLVTANEAAYDDREGIVRVPGPVEFTRGRMKGTGVGATYDRNRDVLWVLDQVHVVMAAEANGTGAVDASASNAGLARADNYMKLVGNAHVVSDGRTSDANEITGLLDDTGQKIQQLQLRENSKITGTGSGAQLMMARNIDLTYAADGRTLQTSKLMENSVVELPGASGGAPKRIGATAIDITMAPDGSTVTNLNAQEKVQVDLPAEGDSPAKQIRSLTLKATGAPGQGIQNAVFEGSVDYTETRAAAPKTPGIDRHGRSQRLIVDTKPGFGQLERADFHGNARFVDGDTTAEAPRALYNIEKDQLELSPSPGDAGPEPLMNGEKLTVQALHIRLSPSTQKLSADTEVRSIIKPQKPGTPAPGGRGGSTANAPQTRVPVMLKQDKPVNVTSNRLEYDGHAEAVYSGNAMLWQDQSRISGDTIILNNETGNLSAKSNVRSTMIMVDEDPKTKVKKPSETKATADTMVYEDAKRVATYTSTSATLARVVSSQGDMKGKRIDLFLKEDGNELEKAVADTEVSVTLPTMFATGKHLVYTAATDTHVMNGEPVVGIQKDDQGQCKRTEGLTLTYERPVDRVLVESMPGMAPFTSKPLPACPAELRH